MKRTCRISGNTFELLPEDLAMLDRLSPEFDGKKYSLPLPTVCPDERKRARLCYRNERNLYHRTCSMSGEPIISLFSPDKQYTVYANEVFWSDVWDPRDHGREFDFSRPFFPQLAELKSVVPRIALMSSPFAAENNCPYVNFAGNSKNCYMIFDSDFDEDSYYSNVLKHSRNCVDCSYVLTSELCYECIDCSNCYSLHYSQDCANCSESYFLKDCIGCSHCFMCANLVQKQYHIRNQPYSREEYLRLLAEVHTGTAQGVESCRNEHESYHLSYPKKFAHVLKTENCSGDYLVNSKNCFQSFNISEGEDLRYCDSVFSAKSCADVSSFGEKIEYVYNSGTVGINAYQVYMTYIAVSGCQRIFYCDTVRQSSHCFGSCSLRRNEYCILNRQYSKEAYEKLVPKIINHMIETGEWGEYFPREFSPFGYNETIAQEVFPLTKQEAMGQGFLWSDYAAPVPSVLTVAANTVPDAIADTEDSITEVAIACEASGRPFRITKAELSFYRKQGIPIPRLHADERHRRRMGKRNPQQLWKRPCAVTGEIVESSYHPERPDIIYSERAYQDIVL